MDIGLRTWEKDYGGVAAKGRSENNIYIIINSFTSIFKSFKSTQQLVINDLEKQKPPPSSPPQPAKSTPFKVFKRF